MTSTNGSWWLSANALANDTPIAGGGTTADGADQARAAGEGDARQIGRSNAGLFQSGVDDGNEVQLMGPRGHLRNHPAIPAVDFLTGHDVAQYGAIMHDGGSRVVAGRFDPQ